mmetsp:Transcript_43633/g.86571  ORF Transcript_43633/g.86571 Transcript_43633/m.86571 type:complete len:86 (+) Transcript_43633:83-340(+)
MPFLEKNAVLCMGALAGSTTMAAQAYLVTPPMHGTGKSPGGRRSQGCKLAHSSSGTDAAHRAQTLGGLLADEPPSCFFRLDACES